MSVRSLRCATRFVAPVVAMCGLAALTLPPAPARAADPPPCPDTGGAFPAACTKEIRVWNNTGDTIYVMLQGSIQKTDALGCTVAAKGGGDVWLQAALGETSQCLAVNHDYYIYVNPINGIPNGGFTSVNLPWWSKRTAGSDDSYIDWWRAGRILIFDDKVALNESFQQLKDNPEVAFAAGSPVPKCKNVADNACNNLKIFQATPEATIGTNTPFQLNEFTFANVTKVTDNGTKGGVFLDTNQGYNVSNVDQVYLPLAIEPVREPADVGYAGTTMSVADFRQRLAAFTGTDVDPDNPIWPVYNNPVVNNKRVYPKAGIRVPSTQTVFSFYMNPYIFPGLDVPQILPATPPKTIASLISQFANCASDAPQNCYRADIYRDIAGAFIDSYKYYLANCSNIPAFLQPVQQNPALPKPEAFLTYVYGWVPFNFACGGVPELPTADEPPAGSRVPIDYMFIQYNYQEVPRKQRQWFNPYTALIHGPANQGGLAANAYAFSIDDRSSFMSNSGGSLPGGLIFAVGGSKGLVNGTQVPPPTPPFYKYFDFVVSLAPPTPGGATWAKYGVCSETADTLFPGSDDGAYGIGVDPSIENITPANPCYMTFEDSLGRKYQLVVKQAKVPPKQIWPTFIPSGGNNYDPNVMGCPSTAGLVPPAAWCEFINQKADPSENPGLYAISGRGPIAN